MKTLVSLYLLSIALLGMGQITNLEKNPYKLVEIKTQGYQYHEDGVDLTIFPAYTILTKSGIKILNVPESINVPHIVEIVPGIYKIVVTRYGKKESRILEVNEDNFQRFVFKRDSIQ